MYAYNLFRSTQPDGLVCAVPEERTVPPFVTGPHWQFGGRISDKETPLGFDKKAAKTGVRFNGFYLFQAFTALILFLAANTSYNAFPRLTAILARDGYAPRHFGFRGDRLAYSVGILVLSAVAIA